MSTDRTLVFGRCIKWALVAAIVAVPVVLVPTAIFQAREAARRQQSKNNLKQIGLALHNYHETCQTFPPGGVFSAEGVPFHGWTTFIEPYIEASPFYNRIDFDRPWDSTEGRNETGFRSNFEQFLSHRSQWLIPGVGPTELPCGLPLVHYSGSDRIFFRNSSVRLKDLSAGTTHVFLAGESFGEYPPVGMPFNWRDSDRGFRVERGGFGYERGPVTLMMTSDGAVHAMDPTIDPEIAAILQGERATPHPSDRARARNATPYEPPAHFLKHVVIDFRNGSVAQGHQNENGELVGLEFCGFRDAKGSGRPEPSDDQAQELVSYPDIRTISAPGTLTDAGLSHVTQLLNLEFLLLSGTGITDAGLRTLSSLPALKRLSLSGTSVTDAGIEDFRRLKPDCEVERP